MALGDGTHKLPIKAALQKVINKRAGDGVSAVIERRLVAGSVAGSALPIDT